MTINTFVEELKKEELGLVKQAQKEIIKILTVEKAEELINIYNLESEHYIKQNIIEIFLMSPDPQYAPVLIKTFQTEKNEDLKFLIAVGLGRSGNEKIINHMVSLFERNDFILCQKVLFTLKSIGKSKPLIEQLKVARGQKLHYITETLKRIYDVKAELLYPLVSVENMELTENVMEILGTIRTKENVLKLLEYLNNSNELISRAAAEGLFLVGEAISEFLGGELQKPEATVNYMKYIPAILARYGDRGQNVLKDILLNIDVTKELMICSIAKNIDYSIETVEKLITFISAVSVETKLTIADALSRFGDNASAIYYKKLYEEQDKNVRAIILSGFIKNEKINTTVLNEVHKFGEEDELKKMFKYVIAHTAPSNAMNIYIDMLRSRNYFERQVAIDILENLDTAHYKSLLEIMGTSNTGVGHIILEILKKNKARVTPFVINLLKEGHDSLKISSAFIIGELKITEAVEQLVASTKDGNEWVRKYAFKALAAIKGEDEARALAPHFNE